MAFNEKKYLDFEGLKAYDTKIKKVIGDADTTLSNAIAQNAADIATEVADRKAAVAAEAELARAAEKANADAIVAEKERAEAAEKALDDKITAANNALATDKAALEAAIEAEQERAEAAEKTLTDNLALEVARATKAEEDLQAAIDAHEEFVDAKLTTLIGADTDKSVRKIANEELAAQLLSGDADADFKTLQELAAWLENHPEDVAAINLAITNLQDLVGTIPENASATNIVAFINEVVKAEQVRAEEAEKVLSERITREVTRAEAAEQANAKAIADEKTRAEQAEAGLDERLVEVETLLGEGGGVDERIADAINALDNKVTSTGSDLVTVKVDQIDGKVTAVTVTEDLANTYDAKGAAATAESNSKTYTNELEASFKAVTALEIDGLFA